MLMTKVKVGNITNLSEARYCAGMGVDLLSFPVSAVDPKMYKEITAWVAGPQFGIALDSRDITLMEEYDSDFVEVSCGQFDHIVEGKNFVVAVKPEEWLDRKRKLIRSKQKILYIEFVTNLVDDDELAIVKEMANDFRVLLKITDNFTLDILKWPIAGISLEGAAESRPGLKEYPLAEILEILETESAD